METMNKRRFGILMLVFASLGVGCQKPPPDSGLLEANLFGAALRALQNQQETVALSGRLRASGGLPLQHARVTFAPANGSALWSCTTDANGFWNVDMSLSAGSVSFMATVEKDSQTIAVFLIEIGIVPGPDHPSVRVSTSVISGDIEAEAAAYVRSSLLVSGNPPLMLEGTALDVRLKFNQSQSGPRTVTVTSSDGSLLSVNGLPEALVHFEPTDATVDHTVRLEALADPDVVTETATLTIRTDGLPDIVIKIVIQDSDIPAMVVTGATSITENGGSAVLMVRPSFPPEAPITFALSSEDGGRLTVSPAVLQFTPQNYLTPQPITVTGQADTDFTNNAVNIRFTTAALPQPIKHSITVIDTTPLFAAPVSVGGSGGTAAALCDITGDGSPDLVTALGASAQIRVVPNTSSAGSIVWGADTVHPSAAAGGLAVGCADLDGDGRTDVFLVHRALGQWEALRNTTAGAVSFAAGVPLAVGSGPVDSLAVDLDGDGRTDIVTADRDGNRLSILANSSSPGSLSFSTSSIATTARPAFVGRGDFDGDGRPDLVIVHDFSSAASITVLRNTSSVGAISFAAPVLVSNLAGFGLVVADLNGDGRSEIVTITDSGSRLRVLSSGAATPFVFTITQIDSGMDGIPGSYFSRQLLSTDLDGDGLPELIFVNPLDATTGVFRNLGGLAFTARHEFSTGTSFLSAFGANLDGAGRMDVGLLAADGSWVALRTLLP